ncbi:hypothetical protein [Paenibacillus lautus]|nr:hypothetical protein [Paenibacillus lautus]
MTKMIMKSMNGSGRSSLREEADDWLSADIGFFGAPRKGQVL